MTQGPEKPAPDPLTVGALRAVIDGLPDETPIGPDWRADVGPRDSEPGVEIFGFERRGPGRGYDTEHVVVRVGLFYLEDLDEEEDEEDA